MIITSQQKRRNDQQFYACITVCFTIKYNSLYKSITALFALGDVALLRSAQQRLIAHQKKKKNDTECINGGYRTKAIKKIAQSHVSSPSNASRKLFVM
jgi:uncharacterized protein